MATSLIASLDDAGERQRWTKPRRGRMLSAPLDVPPAFSLVPHHEWPSSCLYVSTCEEGSSPHEQEADHDHPATPPAGRPAAAGPGPHDPTGRSRRGPPPGAPRPTPSGPALRRGVAPLWPLRAPCDAGRRAHRPQAPAPPAGATMRPRTAVWPPQAGRLGDAGCRNRAPLPAGCPLPGTRGRKPAAHLAGSQGPLILARMSFPKGAGGLKMPSEVAPRCHSTTCWCRRRATNTLLR
jgi:hypothetical protein